MEGVGYGCNLVLEGRLVADSRNSNLGLALTALFAVPTLTLLQHENDMRNHTDGHVALFTVDLRCNRMLGMIPKEGCVSF